MFTHMVDMAQTPEEIEEETAPQVVPAMQSGPKYPYGLCLSLTEDDLEKLGLDDEELPSVGDLIHLQAMAKVTSVSENERVENGETKHCCRIELQITHLAAEDEDEEDPDKRVERSLAKDKERESALYGDEDEEDE